MLQLSLAGHRGERHTCVRESRWCKEGQVTLKIKRAAHKSAVCCMALGSSLAGCGPSVDALPGRLSLLSLSEAASLTVDEGEQPSGRDAGDEQPCGAAQQVKFVREVQQVTWQRCNNRGVAEFEAFRLSEPNEQQLSENLQRLRMKRFEKPVPLCLRPNAGLSRIVFESQVGRKETYVALDALSESDSCTQPASIDGVFDRAELEAMLLAIKKLTQRS